MITFITAISSFVLSAVFVAIVLYVSRKYSWFDHHNERKIHTGLVPRLGGIGFAVSFLVVTVSFIALNPGPSLGFRFISVLFALPLVLIFGVIDDFRPLQPRYKMFAQSAAAIIVIAAGFSFKSIDFSSLGVHLDLGLLRYPLTFLWIVGVTNALNFIDGVDGLAGGVSFLAALGYATIFISADDMTAAIFCIIFASVIGGFLIYNLPLPKARIFMGDGGSQFLGFTLALMPLMSSRIGQNIIPLPYAAAILLIPIFDTFSAVWRRIRDGRRIDSPDMAHMHHKLMNLGLSARGVDGVLWGLQMALSTMVLFSRLNTGWGSLLFLLSAYVLALAFFTIIHFLNRHIAVGGKIKIKPLYPEFEEANHGHSGRSRCIKAENTQGSALVEDRKR